jgi:hypothetical protein
VREFRETDCGFQPDNISDGPPASWPIPGCRPAPGTSARAESFTRSVARVIAAADFLPHPISTFDQFRYHVRKMKTH